jgi:hypothetical protein
MPTLHNFTYSTPMRPGTVAATLDPKRSTKWGDVSGQQSEADLAAEAAAGATAGATEGVVGVSRAKKRRRGGAMSQASALEGK